jgi:hypothetical protein
MPSDEVERDVRLLRAVAKAYNVAGYRAYYEDVARRHEAGEAVPNLSRTLHEAYQLGLTLGLPEASEW